MLSTSGSSVRPSQCGSPRASGARGTIGVSNAVMSPVWKKPGSVCWRMYIARPVQRRAAVFFGCNVQRGRSHEGKNAVSWYQFLSYAWARPRRVEARERDAPVRISHSWSDISPSPFCSGSGSCCGSGSLFELDFVVGSEDVLRAARSRRVGALALRSACQCVNSDTRCTRSASSP